MTKMTKEARDSYVQNYYGSQTNEQLAGNTGWSVTTIKSVKTRLGLAKKSKKRLELEAYCLGKYPTEDAYQIAAIFNTKVDLVRDTLKFLGIWISPSEEAEQHLKKTISEKFKLLTYGKAANMSSFGCLSCGHEFEKRTNNVVSCGVSCPSCGSSVGRVADSYREVEDYPDAGEYCYLYLAKVGATLVKVGVSKEPRVRVGAISRSSDKEVQLVYELLCSDREEAQEKERVIKRYFKEVKYVGPVFEGSSECFYIDKVLEHPFIREIFDLGAMEVGAAEM